MHWIVAKNADFAGVEEPWYVEHAYDDTHPHFDDWHEYGCFETHAEALAVALKWAAQECKEEVLMPKTWPEGEYERAAYQDWQQEVSNGETLRGFREWLRAGEEED